MDELQAGIEPTLAVLSQPPVFLQPGKAALHYPTFWHDLEGVQLTTFCDLHRNVFAQCFAHALRKGLTHIAAIAQHTLHLLEARFAAFECLQRPFAVSHLGGGHRHRVRQALRVYCDVTLYP